MSNTSKNITKTAKLDRELFFKIGNGKIDISNNAINFMLYTISYVAKDGRIYCKKDVIRNELFLQNKTLDRVINELTELNLLSEKEGFLYSHFHVLSNGDKEDKGYVRNIKALTSVEILSLNKTKKRFFLYVASFASMGVPKKVSVEALYSNKYHSGVSYIESYQELAEILFEFVQKGLFVVYINGKRYDNKSSNFEEVFHDYCGYDKTARKKRMSMKRAHQIGISIHKSLVNEINPNESSKAEFCYFADEHHIYHEVMRPKTIPYFINLQNELFNSFGMAGLDLYRNSLESYFVAEKENVLYHDLLANEKETKAVNTMVDFYLIKDIHEVILKVVTNNTQTVTENYFKNNKRLAELVNYFIEKSSDNHKVILEDQLEEHGIQLESLANAIPVQNKLENHWLFFKEYIANIYDQFEFNIEHFTVNHKKSLVRQWAKEGILMRKEELEKSVNKLKEKVLILPKNSKFIIESLKTSNTINRSERRKNTKTAASSLREIQIEFEKKIKEEGIEDIQFNF